MLRVEFACSDESREIWIAELWDMGCSGITELDAGLRAFFPDTATAALRARLPDGTRIDQEAEVDWVAESRSKWEPLSVGEKFFIVPDWRDDPTPPGRFRIPVNPGMAFGTGVHETTRLCLLAIEKLLRPGDVLFDVGTGSGILAVAAGLLGASLVVACDEDPLATPIARTNLNRAGIRHLVFTGSANAVAPSGFDLAVCNISPEAAITIAPELYRCLKPGGRGIVSGFEVSDLPRLEGVFTGEVSGEGPWCAITFSR